MRPLLLLPLLAGVLQLGCAAFVNCLAASSVSTLVASDVVIPTEAGNASRDICNAACIATKHVYALYAPGSCHCANEPVASSTTTADVMAAKEDGTCPAHAYTLSVATRKWTFKGCGAPTDGGVVGYTPSQCLAFCGEEAWAVVQRHDSARIHDSGWSCTCLSAASCPHDQCGLVEAIYYHRPVATGALRRRRRARGYDGLCPAPMVACADPRTEGYECLDAHSELNEF